MSKLPEYDPEEIIKRLMAEQSQTGNTLQQIRRAINSDPEFQDLSLVGGIRAIIKRYKEEQEKNLQLNREIKSLMQQRSTKKVN